MQERGTMRRFALALICLTTACYAEPDSGLQNFAREFFAWRARTQPATSDDILRVERPQGWTADYSPVALARYRKRYAEFKERLTALPRTHWTRSDSVDFLLLRSAIERVNWELNVLRLPERNPDFYVHQSVGALYELLLIHTPITPERALEMIRRIESFPVVMEHARLNLKDPVKAFARIAVHNCKDIGPRLAATAAALKARIPEKLHARLDKGVESGARAIEGYSRWLQQAMPNMSEDSSVGREMYTYFLREVALVPYSPEELLLMGAQEWNRSVAFDVYEEIRNADVPEAGYFSTIDEQTKQSRKDEEAIRRFMEEKNIMSVPDWMQHYINKPVPDYLAPFTNMGVVDDLTSEKRLDEDGVSYIPEPGPDLPFFNKASARDPRPIIIHEGVPGHYFQLTRSWANPNPIRRRFFDSGPIEGIGFYVEELMLQFGLFDDRPHTREIIYRFMRLRALRVDVDVNLALGNYTIAEAGKYLQSTVPMDEETAVWEAGFFAATPGQAITYQIGKLQIFKLIADGKLKLGDKFSLRDYHDYMMENGNVPIAIQRWEFLGLRDELDQLWPKQN